jgi:EpsI family protein
LPDQFVLPDDIAEWRTSEQLPPLQPKYTEPRLAAHRGYTSGAAPVFMYVGYYRNQTTEHRLVSSINVLVDDAKDNPWRAAEQGRRTVRIGTTDIEVERIILRDLGRRTLVTWQWYWVAGKHTGSPYLAKLYQAESMLLGRGDGGAKILVYSMLGDEPQAAAEEQLAAFVASAAARLEPALNDVNTR